MSFFIQKNENLADKYLDPNLLMKGAPDYYGPRFDAIAELRALDDGSLHKGSGFRRVASLVNVPLVQALSTVLDGEWIKDRTKFYQWLDRNPQYCTYQRPSRAGRLQQIQRDLGNLGKEIPNGTPVR